MSKYVAEDLFSKIEIGLCKYMINSVKTTENIRRFLTYFSALNEAIEEYSSASEEEESSFIEQTKKYFSIFDFEHNWELDEFYTIEENLCKWMIRKIDEDNLSSNLQKFTKYFKIIPRLKRQYISLETQQDMQNYLYAVKKLYSVILEDNVEDKEIYRILGITFEIIDRIRNPLCELHKEVYIDNLPLPEFEVEVSPNQETISNILSELLV